MIYPGTWEAGLCSLICRVLSSSHSKLQICAHRHGNTRTPFLRGRWIYSDFIKRSGVCNWDIVCVQSLWSVSVRVIGTNLSVWAPVFILSLSAGTFSVGHVPSLAPLCTCVCLCMRVCIWKGETVKPWKMKTTKERRERERQMNRESFISCMR